MLDQSVLGALAAGALSFLSPCILPLVPAYLCFLTGMELDVLAGRAGVGNPVVTAEGGSPHPAASDAAIGPVSGSLASGVRSHAVSRAFFFVLGFATVFVALGATATTLGRFVATWFDTLAIVAGALLVIVGLHFLGLFRIGLLYREARFQTAGAPIGPLGAYLVGLAFAFGWTPCVGPVLAAILMTAGTQETTWHGAVLLTAYAAGIGIPFLLAAFFVGPFLRFAAHFRQHLSLVEKIMGAVLVITGLLFVTGGMPLVGNWLLQTFPVFGKIG